MTSQLKGKSRKEQRQIEAKARLEISHSLTIVERLEITKHRPGFCRRERMRLLMVLESGNG